MDIQRHIRYREIQYEIQMSDQKFDLIRHPGLTPQHSWHQVYIFASGNKSRIMLIANNQSTIQITTFRTWLELLYQVLQQAHILGCYCENHKVSSAHIKSWLLSAVTPECSKKNFPILTNSATSKYILIELWIAGSLCNCERGQIQMNLEKREAQRAGYGQNHCTYINLYLKKRELVTRKGRHQSIQWELMLSGL